MSNDNAYAEALFKTAKYCPFWPERPFDTLDEARAWVHRFVHWYNEEHCHSGLKYITPNQRHRGQADSLLAHRRAVYEAARASEPERWAGPIRNWNLDNVVYLNPERKEAAPAKMPIAA